ncbi:unnamed protein product [Tilletia caries]|uniref:Uncharacterized protein n=1 Tax=Tilletia caries TaxID=13290 RepID=A0ABN7ITY6_9BASI|nr:unnamed protein product [Tilletia caries]CAD6911537.1 unnamed protein product [Tilletia caries]
MEKDVRRIESARKAQKPITDFFSKVTDTQASAQNSGSSTDTAIVVDDPDAIFVGDDNDIEK